MKSDLGLNPNSDGVCIRLNLPQLTEERRKDLVKVVHKKLKNIAQLYVICAVMLTNAIKKAEKAKEVTEDEAKKGTEQVQKLTDKIMKDIDGIAANKEKEVMEV